MPGIDPNLIFNELIGTSPHAALLIALLYIVNKARQEAVSHHRECEERFRESSVHLARIETELKIRKEQHQDVIGRLDSMREAQKE